MHVKIATKMPIPVKQTFPSEHGKLRKLGSIANEEHGAHHHIYIKHCGPGLHLMYMSPTM